MGMERTVSALISIALDRLAETAYSRPPGYYKHVVSSGKIIGNRLFLDVRVYKDLCRQYSPKPTLAKNIAGASFRVAKAVMGGERIIVSQAEIERRLSICAKCEFFEAAPMKCRKCGCYLNLKTRLETEHCPIAKW
jgi:hypothetical protein